MDSVIVRALTIFATSFGAVLAVTSLNSLAVSVVVGCLGSVFWRYYSPQKQMDSIIVPVLITFTTSFCAVLAVTSLTSLAVSVVVGSIGVFFWSYYSYDRKKLLSTVERVDSDMSALKADFECWKNMTNQRDTLATQQSTISFLENSVLFLFDKMGIQLKISKNAPAEGNSVSSELQGANGQQVVDEQL